MHATFLIRTAVTIGLAHLPFKKPFGWAENKNVFAKLTPYYILQPNAYTIL